MDEKKTLAFQHACKHYLRSKSLEKLRSFGRALGVNRSTAKNKDCLIDDIISVLLGRVKPQYTKKGAPILNGEVDKEIPETVKRIYKEIFDVNLNMDTFEFYVHYHTQVKNSNVLRMEEPEYVLREKGVQFFKKTGQLQEIDGVNYLLPLNCKDNGETVVIHAEIVHRHKLLDGDVIRCEAAQGQSAFIVSSVSEINEIPIDKFLREAQPQRLDCAPARLLKLYDKEENGFDSCKYLDWTAPIRKGQRCCVIAPPKTGKTHLLQELTQSVQALNPNTKVLALLIDQPPETVGQFARILPQDNLVYTTYDDEVDRQVFMAEFVLNRAKRLSECGKDVILFVDSFSGLAKAFNDTDESTGGKTLPCGLESKTLQYLKKYLASAGNFENGGTLTIIGTATTETGNPFDDIIAAEIAPVLNHEIRLNEKLAYKRLYPALDYTKIHLERRDCSAEESNRNALMSGYLSKNSAESFLQILLASQDIVEFEKRIKERK